VEDYLIALDGTTLASDILKAGHHGSRTSSGVGFVREVAPRYAVISAGCENPYGHPHEETLETLKAASSTILSTCEEGTIVFVSDGATLRRE
jgi:competence protein ComEC